MFGVHVYLHFSTDNDNIGYQKARYNTLKALKARQLWIAVARKAQQWKPRKAYEAGGWMAGA